MATYPDDADGAVLAEIAAHGVDMTQPLPIEFAIAVPDETSASNVCEAATNEGYDAQSYYDDGEPDEEGEIDADDEEFGPSWTVYVNIEMVPDYHEIVRIQEDLERLAQPHGGNCDGWGVLLEE